MPRSGTERGAKGWWLRVMQLAPTGRTANVPLMHHCSSGQVVNGAPLSAFGGIKAASREDTRFPAVERGLEATNREAQRV